MKTNETTKGRSAISVMPKCPIPKLLPYDKLVKEINQIDIGNVYRFHEKFQGAIGDELTQVWCQMSLFSVTAAVRT